MELRQYLDKEGKGSVTKLANAIGAYASDVSDWANKNRRVPSHFCKDIERETNGLVNCRDLRPDDWQKYWPEPAAKKAA